VHDRLGHVRPGFARLKLFWKVRYCEDSLILDRPGYARLDHVGQVKPG
jgi:hypothetical protein